MRFRYVMLWGALALAACTDGGKESPEGSPSASAGNGGGNATTDGQHSGDGDSASDPSAGEAGAGASFAPAPTPATGTPGTPAVPGTAQPGAVPAPTPPPVPRARPAADGDTDEALPPAEGEPSEAVVANPFVETAFDPFSTFAADVDTASYDTFVQFVSGGTLPRPQTVRVEDFVNYFEYDYPAPPEDGAFPFSIHLGMAPHPMDRGTDLLRVGIQAKEVMTEKQPANLVFLVDVSGSMASADKLPLVKVLLRETLAVLDDTDTVSIVSYASNGQVVLPPTQVSESGTITAAIDGLVAAGSTAGGMGIQMAYQQAADARIEDGINHVIMCTDGDFNVGITDPDQLADYVEGKRDEGTTLTAIGFGAQRSGDARMEQISNHGDGIYAVVYNEDQAVRYANQRLLSTLIRVAKDMKIQVEMNPDHVAAYRLIGYENRAIADNDFRNDVVDAGDIGSGHRVTALYEIVRAGDDIPMPSGAPMVETGEPVDGTREISNGEMVRVKVRYKAPGATSDDPASEVAASLAPDQVASDGSELGDDFLWAAAVGTLAEVLRNSPYASDDELQAVADEVARQKDGDVDRAQLADLMQQVLTLRGVQN